MGAVIAERNDPDGGESNYTNQSRMLAKDTD